MTESKIELEDLGTSSTSVENDKLYSISKKIYDTQYSLQSLQSKQLKFNDGVKKIDIIICYQEEEFEESPNPSKKNEKRKEELEKRKLKRELFLKNLAKELDLETVEKHESIDNKTTFIKIYLPKGVEHKYADAYKMSLPVKNFESHGEKGKNESEKKKSCLSPIWNICKYDEDIISKEPSFYNEIKKSKGQQLFLKKIRYETFDDAQRSALVMQILLRTKYDDVEKNEKDDENSSEKVGILNLINDGVFSGCFPLHEVCDDNTEIKNDRVVSQTFLSPAKNLYLCFFFKLQTLVNHWSNIKNWYKKQPLWLVKKYFGEKIALYFCWLEFYTIMLTVPAIGNYIFVITI